jgi:hypothetical protein
MKLRPALVLAAAIPAAALAQSNPPSDAPAPRAHRSVPELDGHVFMPSFLVDSPFRQTTFKLGLLYGVGDATGPKYDINGNPVAGQQANYTLGTLAQTFRYDYAFNEWLSAGAVVLTSMYTGLDGPSAVSVGAQFGIGMGARLKAGHRFGPVETAFVIEASTGPEFGILVAAAILKALQENQLEPGSALQATHVVTVTPGLAASWAPSPALGLTVNAAYVYKSLRLSGGQTVTDQSGIQFGGVADFDFGKISSVPIGVLAGFRVTSPLGTEVIPAIKDFSAGILYTGIRELALGVEVGWRSFTLRPGSDVPLDSTATVAQIELQYYW